MRALLLLQTFVPGLSELTVAWWPERVKVMPTSMAQLWEGLSTHPGHRRSQVVPVASLLSFEVEE